MEQINYGQNLKNYRTANGFTQKAMAEKLGITHQQSYNRLENNLNKIKAEQIGYKLGVDLTADPNKRKLEDIRKMQQFILYKIAALLADKKNSTTDAEMVLLMIEANNYVQKAI